MAYNTSGLNKINAALNKLLYKLTVSRTTPHQAYHEISVTPPGSIKLYDGPGIAWGVASFVIQTPSTQRTRN